MTNMKKMTMIPLLASFILGSTLWSGGFTANAAAAATTSTTAPTSATTTSDKSANPQTNHLPNIKILATEGPLQDHLPSIRIRPATKQER